MVRVDVGVKSGRLKPLDRGEHIPLHIRIIPYRFFVSIRPVSACVDRMFLLVWLTGSSMFDDYISRRTSVSNWRGKYGGRDENDRTNGIICP